MIMKRNVCLKDFEEKAYKLIEKAPLDYYRSGAGEEYTLNLNQEAFKRLRIRPRCLRDASQLNIACRIFDQTFKWPVGIAPSAMQKMAHTQGEGGNAQAAGRMGSIYILSTLATMSIEEVAAAAPTTCKWFQLYVHKNRQITEELVRRAEKANYKAIVLTVDAQVIGQRWADIRNNFGLPQHLQLANFTTLSNYSSGIQSVQGNSGLNEYASNQFDNTLSWQDVEWLVKLTSLPVIVKGILTAEDAVLAREFGCAGVIVSNHGARQLDYVPASIEALPEVAKAVGKNMLVMLDGGVRHGTDVFKALALGAKMVFIGRPALWSLACGGQAAVEEMLQILRREFEVTMALTGCQTLDDIQPNMVVHESYYSKL